jgi:NDP-sugar pyrophosphorylase family protein
MKAMVLAAGLGTRLRPLTDNRPKALMEVAGRTLLQITLARLRTFDVREVIVNVHHFADQIIEYLKVNNSFGMRVEISREDVLLDTGGGLKKAAWFFLEDAASRDESFILHNVDVISTIDFVKMVEAHEASDALATLAVQKRESSRQLLFDENLQLCGRRAGRDREPDIVRPSPRLDPLAFSGIHVISPRLLPMLTEDGVFSIVTSYLRLAGSGQKVAGFPADEYYWRDLGRQEDLRQAELDLEQKIVQ